MDKCRNRLYPLFLTVLASLFLAFCNLHSLRTTQVLSSHSERVMSASWSPDGRYLASGGFDGILRIWNITSGTEQKILRSPSPYILSVSWSPDGKRLISVSNDSIQLWDPDTGREIRTVRTNPPQPPGSPPVYGPNNVSAVWSTDGQRLGLFGWTDKTIRLLDATTGEGKIVLKGHTAEASSVAWSPDGRRLVSAGWDNTLRLWDAATGKEEAVINGQTKGWIHAFWSPDGRRLAWHGYMSDLRILDVNTRSVEQVLHHGSGILHVAWSPDGMWLASASRDGTVKLWTAATWQEDRVLHPKNKYYIDYMTWSPDGRRLAMIVFMDKTVRVWHVAAGKEERFRGHKAPVITIAWSPNGKQLASGSYDRTIRIWDLIKTEEAGSGL